MDVVKKLVLPQGQILRRAELKDSHFATSIIITAKLGMAKTIHLGKTEKSNLVITINVFG